MTIIDALEALNEAIQQAGGDRIERVVVSRRSLDAIRAELQPSQITTDLDMNVTGVKLNGVLFMLMWPLSR